MISKNILLDKRKDEKIIIHLRRHWYIFFKLFIGYFLLSFIPLFAYYFLYLNYGVDLMVYIDSESITAFFKVAFLLYYMAMIIFSFTLWTETYLDVWTITSERIISRNQKGLFNRIVSELEIAKIQDVTVEQKGMLATFLGFGDIYIQTAGEKERFIFQQVPHPYKVAKTIQNLDEEIKNCHNHPTV